MERETYDRMAEIDGAHWWFVARREIIASLIEAHAPAKRPLRILEVGAGTGSNIALLQRYGAVDAIEPDDGARALASKRTGVAIKGGYLPDVPLDDGAYDLIVLLDVLEHIPDDLGALQSLRSKLAPGGRLMVTVPAMPWLWSAHDAAHHHQRRYTAATLEAVFASAGYATQYRAHFNSVLMPAIVGARAIGKLMGREGGDDAMPPKPVNAVLRTLFGVERHWVARWSPPLGVSLALIAEPSIR